MELLAKLSVLEVFNGRRILDSTVVEQFGSSGGAGSGSGGGGGGGGAVAGPPSPAERFVVNLDQQQIEAFQSSYRALRDSVYGALVMQTRLSRYLDSIRLVIDEQGVKFDSAALAASLETLYRTDPRAAVLDMLDLTKFAGESLKAVQFDNTLLAKFVSRLPSDSPVRAELSQDDAFSAAATQGTTAADLYFAGAASSRFDGGAGEDQLFGGAGDDALTGGAGNDVLTGGAGNDVLDGGVGNDSYVFAIGSGVDRISEYDSTAGNTDVVTFADVASTALTSLERKGDDLVIKYGASDQLTVTDYFNASYPGYKIEQFKFSDGVTWSEADIKARVITNGDASGNSISGYNDGSNRIYGLGGSDNLYGGALADLVDGGEGDDNLSGYAGADTLLGGVGNDSLRGGSGEDTLDGGAGNDVLDGDVGNDTYKFSVGSGVDRISEYDSTAGNTDVVTFADVASTALTSLERKGDDLVVKYGTSDQLTVSRYFDPSYPGYQVEQFKFSDDVTWDVAVIKARASANATTASASTTNTGGISVAYGFTGGASTVSSQAQALVAVMATMPPGASSVSGYAQRREQPDLLVSALG